MDFFELGDSVYSVSMIESLTLDGGLNGHGCWGKIKLRGQEECDIGDGSYAGDGRHIRHKVARRGGQPDFGFTVLREIMRRLADGHSAGGSDDRV